MRRAHLFHIGLFFAAYSGFLAYHASRDQQQSPLTMIAKGIGTNAAPSIKAPTAAERREPLSARVSTAAPAANAVEPRAQQIGPATPSGDTGGPSPETLNEMDAFATQALRAPEIDDRAEAIVALRNGAKTPSAIQALTTVLAADQIAQNRMLAVAALRDLARQGDEDYSVITALRMAAADSDQNVAASASEALAMLQK